MEARRRLTLAAVAGRRFDFALLHALTGHDERQLLELIKELIAAQLVIEESAETFAFRHALTREVLYADLLARERRALHGAIAEALAALAQARGGEIRDVWVADLAEHCYQAGLWAQALEYAQLAAARAQRLYAPRAAITHLSRALEATRQLERVPLPALYRSRGQMYELLGAFEQAHADYQAALASAQSSGDRQAQWQVLLDLGFLWAERDYLRMGEYRRRALDLARTLDDPVSLGHSLNRVGNWYLFVEQPREALHYHQEALTLFKAANDRRGLAATYDLLGVTNMMSNDIPAGVAHYEQAVALFRELGDLQGLSSSLATRAMRDGSYSFNTSVCLHAEREACDRDGEEALRIARQIGWRSGEAGALSYLAMAHGSHGEYAAALERARLALAIAQEIEHRVWLFAAHFALGAIAFELLALETARQQLEQALVIANQIGMFFVRIVVGFLASNCIAQRDFARARTVLAVALDPDTTMETRGQRLCWCARAELVLAEGDPAAALQIVDPLIASATNVEAYGDGCVPRLWHLRGVALAALERTAEAEAALLAADVGATSRGLHPIRWRILSSLGRLYQAQGRRKQAEMAFATARAIVEDLANGIPDGGLREEFVRNASAQLPLALSPRAAARREADGLTAREREVAALIAQGRINREIAEALVVSERTVESHVANILAKLGFSSRRQVVAWAAARNLVNNPE